MKFEAMYIAFNGENEKNMLCMILESIGYKALDQLNVGQRYFSTDRVGNFWTTNTCIFPDMIVCFGGFVNKYKIHSKAYRAMTDFNLNKNQLSLKLGFSRQYIGRVLSKPQSEKVQKNVIEKIDELYRKKENSDIDAFNQKSIENFQNNQKDKEIAQLKKELDHKNQVLDKRNDLMKDKEYEISCLNDSIKSMQIDLNGRTIEIVLAKNKLESLSSIKVKLKNELNFSQKSLNKRNKDVKILTFAVWVLIVVIFALIGFMVFA